MVNPSSTATWLKHHLFTEVQATVCIDLIYLFPLWAPGMQAEAASDPPLYLSPQQGPWGGIHKPSSTAASDVCPVTYPLGRRSSAERGSCEEGAWSERGCHSEAEDKTRFRDTGPHKMPARNAPQEQRPETVEDPVASERPGEGV